ncbi:hypothetical protein Tco_0129270, partial [Tanacetum coccineum]
VKIKIRDQGDLQVQADAELAQRLHEEELAELERAQQERQRQEDDTNAALAKEFDEIQAIIDADYELAIRLTHEEQEKNKMITYLKHIAIKDNEKKVDSSSKPAGGKDVAEEQESAKSDEEAAADYKHEKEGLRMWLTVVSDEEETVDPKIFSTKYPIVDWESQNLGNVDMEDLYTDWLDLHRFMMKMFEETTLEGYNLLLWGDLKLQHVSREKVSSYQGNATKDVELEAEAEAESTMAFELLKFIKSQLEE